MSLYQDGEKHHPREHAEPSYEDPQDTKRREAQRPRMIARVGAYSLYSTPNGYYVTGPDRYGDIARLQAFETLEQGL